MKARLALLTVEGTTLQIRVEFDFFKSARSPETLFVTCGYVDRWTGAFFFGFRAFEYDYVSWHEIRDYSVSRGRVS